MRTLAVTRLPDRMLHALHVALFLGIFLGLPLGCGGGGGGGDTGTGSGLGPGGLTCTGFLTCFSTPPGTSVMFCTPTTGPSPAVNLPVDRDYCQTALNMIRANLGLPLFTRTAALDAFAQAATADLAAGGAPHAYFSANAAGDPAFTGGRSENQTGPSWPGNTTSIQIDEIIACFMSEEDDPVGFQKGHWESIVCPCLTRIGVGLQKDAGGNLFMTIDFSE
jgi:hypothetical protein